MREIQASVVQKIDCFYEDIPHHLILWLCSYLSSRRCHTTFDAARKSASVVGRHEVYVSVIVGRFHSFLHYWSTSV